MKIAVFGAAGWVGRAVIANLREHDHSVRAIDHAESSWDHLRELDGDWRGDETVYGDISDYDAVQAAIDGVDAVIHTAVLSGASGSYAPGNDAPWLVNLKGLWNVLDVSQKSALRRVVHVGSCQVEHPDGVFFDADTRRPDGSPYAVSKRLQEEMCRQFYDGFGLSIVVLRPCSIVDSRLGLSKYGKPLDGGWNTGWVCRHDLADACRRAAEIDDLGLQILHAAGPREADEFCNAARTREVLGAAFDADLDQYR